MIVQGHPRSIWSSLAVFYVAFIVPNIVSITRFDIFYGKVLWPRSGWFKVIQGQRS